MIVKAEVINQPFSGEYKERVYDISSPWNSQSWSWIKFTNENSTEWCGNFRGFPSGVAVSSKYNAVLVLTSDYLFRLNANNGELIGYEDQPQYQHITVSPSGEFIVADYYDIEIINSTLNKKVLLDSPIKMDRIKFHNWYNNRLLITCEEFLNWDNKVELELDGVTYVITIK
ncbi:hypothetical protein [Bacillus cihuensis]|uniref:hypothetical protein n=1 Tax=Bacillus cihuensis TaxID=1208599 RepID=UPI0003FAF25E|nr:hypothetical protein [Bacillus cihuensis]